MISDSDNSPERKTHSGETIFQIGAILGFLAVAFGAFGTHGLRDRLSTDSLRVWQTGTEYQLVHAGVICFCGWITCRTSDQTLGFKRAMVAGWLFVGGVIVFSSSLYVLALTGIRFVGAITPLGGLFMLAGWICLALTPIREIRSRTP